jgi:hypothetical protein
VQANTLHPDFVHVSRSSESRLVYVALLIGKESIAFAMPKLDSCLRRGAIEEAGRMEKKHCPADAAGL